MSNDFTLPQNAYVSFDAQTLKQLIKNQLTAGGNFTDQNFEGSNISSVIDIIALSYHMLLYYQNQSSANSLFADTTLYENMNRVVKTISYNPTGYKTALLSFQATANTNLLPNIYTITRYAYFTVNGIYYSFTKDITFNVNLSGGQDLSSLYANNLLYEGRFIEYPIQTAAGSPYEVIAVVVKDTINNIPINIDSSGFDVYVKSAVTGNYTQFTLTNSLFLENSNSASYELRLNENGYYEVKFGNGVFGQQLNPGDAVYVYYLQSDGIAGVISGNQLNGNNINFFTSPQFVLISAAVLNKTLNYITAAQASNITFTNNTGSSQPSAPETVNQIRENSPKIFQTQNRLITESDFESWIIKNYSNIVTSQEVVNNTSYINNYIAYFYGLGLDRPNQDPRFLFNEATFAHAGQDNNIHLFMVPAIQTVDSSNNQYFLQNSQKNTIVSGMNNLKAVNMELIPEDPIYIAFTLGLALNNEVLTPDIANETFIVIAKDPNALTDSNQIVVNVNAIFQNYFTATNVEIGQLVSINAIVSQILNVPGVLSFTTQRIVNGVTVASNNGLVLLVFNPNYSVVDIQTTSVDTQLAFFKFPFLYNGTLVNNIIVL